ELAFGDIGEIVVDRTHRFEQRGHDAHEVRGAIAGREVGNDARREHGERDPIALRDGGARERGGALDGAVERGLAGRAAPRGGGGRRAVSSPRTSSAGCAIGSSRARPSGILPWQRSAQRKSIGRPTTSVRGAPGSGSSHHASLTPPAKISTVRGANHTHAAKSA